LSVSLKTACGVGGKGGGGGRGGEMTQALYAHMNNKKKINKKTSLLSLVGLPVTWKNHCFEDKQSLLKT
jgi:hypothetical protein